MSALDKARHYARSEELEVASAEVGEALIEATRQKYELDHSKQAKQLKKSSELNAYVRLFSHPRVFPSESMLEERLTLCLELLEGCQQRPVLEKTGLVMLELDFRHDWTSSHPRFIEQIFELDARQSRYRTVPMLALCMHHSDEFAKNFARRIAESSIQDKRVRVGELIETLDILPEEEPLDDFVELAYDAIFANTDPNQKVLLLKRVIRECLESGRSFEQDRWVMLIDPIISQNLRTNAAVDLLEGLMTQLPERYATRYLVNYTMVMAERRRKFSPGALDLLEAHAPASLIAYLYPSTRHTERGVFGERKSAYATRVEEVIEAIIEREQVDRNAGGLSLSEDGSMGGLTVLDASQGTLSVGAVDAPSAQLDPSALLPPIHDAIEEHVPATELDPTSVVTVLVFAILLAGFIYYIW